MKSYENLYYLKDNPQFVQRHLSDFLLFQIYSVSVFRESYRRWPELYPFIRENIPHEISDLIDKSYHFSDKKLQQILNKYQIENAIRVLKSYQNCGVPLTQDPFVRQTRRKLTTKTGDKNLKILEQAKNQGIYSDKMADLAVRCAHKFLFEGKNYRSWKITSQFAQSLVQRHPNGAFTFPSIQLTKGCENHCSHCCDRAEPHLSHMPWPVFVNLYRLFHQYYNRYPQKTCDHYFAKFFADSDMLSYRDPIMGTDSGDAALWISDEKGECAFLTRGVKDEHSKIALSKAICSDHRIVLSFVDTPKENMTHNKQQLNDTLDVFESIPFRRRDPVILHLCMKSGPTVSDEIFRDFPVEKKSIWAMGRGKDLPANETEHYPDNEFYAPHIISPNGDILFSKICHGENVKKKVGCLYGISSLCHRSSLCQKISKFLKRQR